MSGTMRNTLFFIAFVVSFPLCVWLLFDVLALPIAVGAPIWFVTTYGLFFGWVVTLDAAIDESLRD